MAHTGGKVFDIFPVQAYEHEKCTHQAIINIRFDITKLEPKVKIMKKSIIILIISISSVANRGCDIALLNESIIQLIIRY